MEIDLFIWVCMVLTVCIFQMARVWGDGHHKNLKDSSSGEAI
jgi:hypothetical protein